MKTILRLAAMSFVLLISLGIDGQAQPKEAAEAVTVAGYVTPNLLPLDVGRYRVNYEAIGVVISDTGSGLFHEATVRVLGQFTIEKNKFNDGQDWGIYTLRNGDKVFFTATSVGELEPGGGGEVKVIETFTGGKGEGAGIKGGNTFTRHGLRPALFEGTGLFYMKGTIKYTLP